MIEMEVTNIGANLKLPDMVRTLTVDRGCPCLQQNVSKEWLFGFKAHTGQKMHFKNQVIESSVLHVYNADLTQLLPHKANSITTHRAVRSFAVYCTNKVVFYITSFRIFYRSAPVFLRTRAKRLHNLEDPLN